MASQRPLIFDAARAVSRQLEAGEGLSIGGDLDLAKGAGFWGATPPAAQPALGGEWADSLDALLRLLDTTGFARDTRPAGWLAQAQASAELGKLGPYAIGRLITGSAAGWVALDQPPAAAGVLQVAVAHQGAAQTPAGGGPDQRGLAYLPLLSYGPSAPPSGAAAGCLWYDNRDSGGRVPQLMVYDGAIWTPVLPASLAALAQVLVAARRGAVLTADGSGGVVPLSNVEDGDSTGPAGQVLVFDRDGGSSAISLLTVAGTSPWPNSGSAFAPAPGGGGRPVGVDQALWGCNTPGSESLGFWDETAQQWKTVPVGNPLLQRLAVLSSSLVDGDMLLMRGGQLERLPAGDPGDELVCRPEPAWHARQTHGSTRPTDAIDGDLHLETQPQGATESGGTNRLFMRLEGTWETVHSPGVRVSAVNNTGGDLKVCTPVVLVNGGWQLAPAVGADDARQIVGVITTQNAVVANGEPAGAIIEGVMQQSPLLWNAVLDAGSTPPSSGNGLEPGRRYYVSQTQPGRLTNNPPDGIGLLVGTALASNQLLVQPAVTPGGQALARVSTGTAAPSSAVRGQLWMDERDTPASPHYFDGTGWAPANGFKDGNLIATSLNHGWFGDRNLITNPIFVVTAPADAVSAFGIAAPLWERTIENATATFQQTSSSGYTLTRNIMRSTVTGPVANNAKVVLYQNVLGGIAIYAGQPFALSFEARGAAPAKLGVMFSAVNRNTNAAVDIISMQVVDVDTTTKRFELRGIAPTQAVIDATGATQMRLEFWYSVGSDYSAVVPELVGQATQIDLTKVQLEIGDRATAFSVRRNYIERLLCTQILDIVRFDFRTGALKAGEEIVMSRMITSLANSNTATLASNVNAVNTLNLRDVVFSQGQGIIRMSGIVESDGRAVVSGVQCHIKFPYP